MNKQVTTGVVLARINYGEADRIITILTNDHGKIRLLAKGVRKIKSRLAGGIELFSVNDITYIVGKGDLGTLISSRLQKNFGNIVKNIDRTMFAYDVLKLVNRITEDSPEPEYFVMLSNALEAINDQDNSIDIIRLWMNMQLLKLGGHSPNLITDSEGNKLDANQKYAFGFEEMAFSMQPNGPFQANHIKMLRLAITASSASKLTNVQDADKVVISLGQLSRSMLQQHARTT